MNIFEAITVLEQAVENPKNGLPDEIFYFISSMTPLVNVDLLIKDREGKILLAWRDDEYAGTGWHLPGGIIRFKEKIEERIIKVAQLEIGREVSFDKAPIEIREIIHETRSVRGHFISMLYDCFINNDLELDNRDKKLSDSGFLMWHQEMPDNLLSCHVEYGKYF